MPTNLRIWVRTKRPRRTINFSRDVEFAFQTLSSLMRRLRPTRWHRMKSRKSRRLKISHGWELTSSLWRLHWRIRWLDGSRCTLSSWWCNSRPPWRTWRISSRRLMTESSTTQPRQRIKATRNCWWRWCAWSQMWRTLSRNAKESLWEWRRWWTSWRSMVCRSWRRVKRIPSKASIMHSLNSMKPHRKFSKSRLISYPCKPKRQSTSRNVSINSPSRSMSSGRKCCRTSHTRTMKQWVTTRSATVMSRLITTTRN